MKTNEKIALGFVAAAGIAAFFLLRKKPESAEALSPTVITIPQPTTPAPTIIPPAITEPPAPQPSSSTPTATEQQIAYQQLVALNLEATALLADKKNKNRKDEILAEFKLLSDPLKIALGNAPIQVPEPTA